MEFEGLKGTVAVDAFNELYQFLTTIRQADGTPLMDQNGKVTSHVSGLFYRTTSLLERKIKPIYVFDGKPSLLKENTIMARSEKKQDALEKFEEASKAGDTESMHKFSMQAVRLEGWMIEESKQLLTLMGIPYIQGKTEAEAQCAYMSSKKIVDAAASQDFDSLLFGADVLIRNLTLAGRRKLPRSNQTVEVFPEKYILKENLDSLGISREKLVWIALLCGTDFNKGIFGIGAKKGYKAVKNASSFEEALKTVEGDIPRWKEIEQIFLKPDVFEPKPEKLIFGQPNREELMKFMADQRGFSEERVNSALSRAYKIPEDTNQNNLGKWM